MSESNVTPLGDLRWTHVLSAIGGFSLMYFYTKVRQPSFVQELCSLTHTLGAPKVLQWLRVEQAKRIADGKAFDDYDVVVRLESVLDLNSDSGCPIIAGSKMAAEVFESSISVRTVSVLGPYNTGKSFLQSRLFGFNFPQGPLQRTAACSMKLVENSNLLIVDSAGNLEPVSTESWALEDAVRDRKDVEIMVKELVIQLSDILIVTVNDITWPDQEYCQSLLYKCVERPQKCLIVVHNMKHIYDPDVAKVRFHEDLGQMYQGMQIKDIVGGDATLEFVHRDPTTELVVNHFGLANQYSAAGQKYNEASFKRIRAVIDFHDRIGTKRCIKSVFESIGTKMLPQFFYCDDDASTCKMSLEYEPTEDEAEAQRTNSIGGLFIKAPEDTVVHWKHRTRTNNEGPAYLDSLSNTSDFKPAYSIVVETTKSGKEVCHLQIEAPGCNDSHLEAEDIGEGLLVTINKFRKTTASVLKVVEEGRTFSSWKQLFQYKVPGCGVFGPPDPDDNGVYVEDGLVHVLLPRAQTMGTLTKKTASNGNFKTEEF